jgi:hypothetical protein
VAAGLGCTFAGIAVEEQDGLKAAAFVDSFWDLAIGLMIFVVLRKVCCLAG